MDAFVVTTILGLVLGAVYAIAASGLVLTYTTSGIFNFAHGAQAMLAAFLYWQFTVPWGLPSVVALLLVVGVIGPLIGMGLYQLLMKGLRDVDEVTKVIVTVSVLLGMVQLSIWIWEPAQPRSIELLFGSTNGVEVFGKLIRYGEIFVVAAAGALAIGLRLLFTRTRIGVAMRGAVDDPELLRLNGYNPQRVALTSWALGAALAALAGVLVTPIIGGSIDAGTLTLLIIDAFAAAMFGRLRSIPRTFVGAMVLGLAATYMTTYAPTQYDWVSNLRGALPSIVLFAVLLLLPQDRLRGIVQQRGRERPHVPSVRQALVWAVVFVGLVFLLGKMANPVMIGPWVTGMAFAIVALSLVPLTGYAGEINLVPLSFSAVGIMVAYHVGIDGIGVGSRMSGLGILAGVAATAVVGGLVALPALRLRGLYLALATLAFGGVMYTLVLREINVRHWFGLDIALFPDARLIVPRPKIGPLDLDSDTSYLLALGIVFALLGVLIVALRNSGYGRRLVAMRDSPAATAMLGQRLVVLKLGVFMFSAAIAGLGGIMLAAASGSVSGDDFVITASLVLVMLTVVGGVSYVSGALFGGVMVGVVLTSLAGTSGNLATTNPDLAPTFAFLAHLGGLAIALTGLGVRSNPTGVVHAICSAYRPLLNARPVLYGGLVAEVALVVLDLTETISDWSFALLTLLVIFTLPAFAARLMPEAVLTAREIEERERVKKDTVELKGLAAPLTADERIELDAALGLTMVERRMPGSDALLQVEGVTVRFGGTTAVDDVRLALGPGSITGLIGPNGAGKTTLFNVITGMQRPTAGRVVFDGTDITRRGPAQRAHLGVARTFQRLELFLTLSVRDNVRVAGDIVKARRRGSYDVDAETDRLLELTGLAAIADKEVSDIPTGRARVVEVARALMTEPRLLLLDEPASGQTEQETEEFADMLRGLADSGLGICLVEHDLPLVMSLCSTIHVLDQGRVISSGTPDEVRASPEVIAAYIGAEVTT